MGRELACIRASRRTFLNSLTSQMWTQCEHLNGRERCLYYKFNCGGYRLYRDQYLQTVTSTYRRSRPYYIELRVTVLSYAAKRSFKLEFCFTKVIVTIRITATNACF